jgi:FkbH-like protein
MVQEIAAELNIGLESIVFVDDNPAERALVAHELPEVAVPDVGSDVTAFPEVLERERYFEAHTIVPDDVARSSFYSSNAQRTAYRMEFSSYGEFLASLNMTAEIERFCPMYLDRITQLINKTNQFNLTTRRYTDAEVEAISRDPAYISLYGRLTDRFGDNGLVSVIIGRVGGGTVELDTWLMSCRVLKREFELMMFDALVEQCQIRDIASIVGVYIPSRKNRMVSSHYESLGFSPVGAASEGAEFWQYEIPTSYSPRSRYIRNITDALTCVD